MVLLIAAALGVIAFLLVEGRRAASTPSPVTGAAGAPASPVSGGSDWLPSINAAGLGDPNQDLGFGSPSSWLDQYSATDPGIETPLGPARPIGS